MRVALEVASTGDSVGHSGVALFRARQQDESQ